MRRLTRPAILSPRPADRSGEAHIIPDRKHLSDAALHIGFATAADYATLTDDDRAAIAPLEERGARIIPLIWTEPLPDLPLDAVVIRSCWDYHLRAAEFEAWMDELAGRGVAVINPPALVRWNLHKQYLLDLAGRGVPIVPTVRLTQGDTRTLEDVLRAEGWDEAVVKPAVSLNAWETWRCSPDTARDDEARLAALLARGDVLVQPFIRAVSTDGEWSLVFFADRFSHAVRKRPKAGDFRVQVEHGGSVEAVEPAADLIEAASRVVAALPLRPVYSRIDGVVVDGELLLMEAECIDPVLFLTQCPTAPVAFADALLAALPVHPAG